MLKTKTELKQLERYYGRLTVLSELTLQQRTLAFPKSSNIKRAKVLCSCQPNKIFIVRISNLFNGDTNSCGCLQVDRSKEVNTRHGHTINARNSKTYQVWASLVHRSKKPQDQKYFVNLSDRWYECFENFLKDMGEKPPNTKIQLIDKSLPYQKNNCYWKKINVEN